MQNVLSSSPYVPYQQYSTGNNNYYQGRYPQYNNNPGYYQAPQISSVDWKYINECNAEIIQVTEDVEKMNRLLQIISRSDFQTDSQTNQNPNILKLLRLTQVVVNYLMKCQDDLNEKNKELEQRNSSFENQVKRNNKSSNYYKDKLNKAIVILKKSKTRERCPISSCHTTLQSSQELDQHMRTNHNHLYKVWQYIRKGESYPDNSKNEGKLQRQIGKLQQENQNLRDKLRNQTYLDRTNSNKQKKNFELNLFDNKDKPQFLELSSEDQAPKQQRYPQTQPQLQPQPQPQQVVQNLPKPDDTDDIARLNAKKRAEDFLSHRRPATPMLPQQVDEIVHKISNMLHEQSKQVNYGEVVKEEEPEDLRKDISEDVKSDHPMPETSEINNLKDLKKPLKEPRRKKIKKQPTEIIDEPKENPEQPNKISDDHCYGDSMPLTSSSLHDSMVFHSEIAEYDSNAVPSSAPKQTQQAQQTHSSGEESQSGKKPKTEIQDSEGQQEGSDNSFLSNSGHSKFQMPSNDNDFATYEEFISEEAENPRRNENINAQPAEDEYYYEDEDEANQQVEPDAPPPPAPSSRPQPTHDEPEYSYYYDEDEADAKGYIHPSPQPSNKSLRKPHDEEDELSF